MKKFHNLMVKLQFLHLKVPAQPLRVLIFVFSLTNPISKMNKKNMNGLWV